MLSGLFAPPQHHHPASLCSSATVLPVSFHRSGLRQAGCIDPDVVSPNPGGGTMLAEEIQTSLLSE